MRSKKAAMLLWVCLAAILAIALLTVSCSFPSKEFEATVENVIVTSEGGFGGTSLTVTVYFSNGEVIPFNGDGSSGKFLIGKTYLVKTRQTYLSGEWHLDYLEELEAKDD